MKLALRICFIGALGGAVVMLALDSDQAVLQTVHIGADSEQLTTSFRDIRTVGKGDTLIALLTDAGVTAPAANRAIRALAKVYKPRRIKPGQRIVLTLQQQSSPKEPPMLLSLTFAESVDRDIAVHRTETGYKAQAIVRPLTRVTTHVAGRIDSSLYVAGVAAGLSQSTLANLIQIFSFDVDFQRDIRHGDQFALMFEEYRDEGGRMAKTGNISIAEMILSGQKIRLYRYKAKDGLVDFYNIKGQSVRKALLRTPIDGARISSGFGRRRHPILGYTRMHKGLDFAARRGTPIYAAGDGVVDFAGRNGSYGKYIRIRHIGNYKTAYAHMHRYGKGVRTGRRVRQGQIIGYVGSTGRSTGPHLHYEVHKNGHQVNPRSIKLPSGRKLKGRELTVFTAHRAALDNHYATLTQTQRVAKRPNR
jgi:murein DD-endopeptidase MepM/ murein hydrolase activator NlpD